MYPSDEGRCEECGEILTEEDYVNGECPWCGAEIEDEYY
jgi:predicted RNA-binding Zn-ribbon protein involved in translation (DUF1610 family)